MDPHYPTLSDDSDRLDDANSVGLHRSRRAIGASGVDPSRTADAQPTLPDDDASGTALKIDGGQPLRVPPAPPGPHSPLPGAAPLPRVFLTAREVGQQLGIRKSRVYELAAAGLLPVVRMGRRILFPCRGLDALATAAIERARSEVLGVDTSYPAGGGHAPLRAPNSGASDSRRSVRSTGRRAA